MAIPQLPFLETMITQVCNLSCHGCTNFSDLKHSGYVPWSLGQQWIEEWKSKIEILDFGIMGGEPLINPEWKKWVTGVRTLLPTAQIRFTTNGLLLHRYPEILEFFEDCGNIVFKITQHLNDNELDNSIKKIFDSVNWQPVTEFGIKRWQGKNKVRLQINKPEKFLKTYCGDIKTMTPWNSNPIDAFNQCIQQTCPLLHNGRIYKCSTSALTKEIRQRFNNENDQWKKFEDNGIGITSSGKDIEDFINNFGKPHSICAQCPDSTSQSAIIDHKITVFKK